jgi:hypothetical protein
MNVMNVLTNAKASDSNMCVSQEKSRQLIQADGDPSGIKRLDVIS